MDEYSDPRALKRAMQMDEKRSQDAAWQLSKEAGNRQIQGTYPGTLKQDVSPIHQAANVAMANIEDALKAFSELEQRLEPVCPSVAAKEGAGSTGGPAPSNSSEIARRFDALADSASRLQRRIASVLNRLEI